MNPIVNIAIRAIRKGGDFLAQNYDSKYINNIENIDIKKYLLNIKQKTFYIINNIIHQSYPNHYVLNFSDTFQHKNRKNSIKWIINTIDGSINFIKKVPHFCTSIIIENNNEVYSSIIYDPIKNDLFTAVKGRGAQLNGYRIRVNYKNNLINTIISTNFFNNKKSLYKKYFNYFKKFFAKKYYLWNTGSIELDLAYLSANKIDLFIGFEIEKIEKFAGILQIKESGAIIQKFEKDKMFKEYSLIIIGNNKIVRKITEEI